jgi:hypothetical protein
MCNSGFQVDLLEQWRETSDYMRPFKFRDVIQALERLEIEIPA